jgi:hypothetical protein
MDVTELKRHRLNASRRHPWEIVRSKIIIYLLRRYNIRSPQHILELGSGDAYLSNQLSEIYRSSSISAVDTAYTDDLIQSFPRSAISYYNNLADFSATNKPADLILLADVLEHVEDDRSLYQSALDASVSTSSAYILITVPAFQSLFSKHDRQLEHFRRYTRKQLLSVCSTSGMEIINSGYFFFSLLIVRWIAILFESSDSTTDKSTIENWRGGRIVTNLISFILWIDFSISFFLTHLGIVLPGLSCYCLCRKSPS